MATLNDSAADFPDVYQLENGDPLVGGVPNEGTGAGMDNIPHLQLARRDRHLLARVVALEEGEGGSAATTETPGIVQLSDSVTSTATDKAATPNAVKIANDNANGRVPTSREVKGSGLVTGGGALTANRTLTVTPASDADAIAGTRADVAMTPKSAKAVLDDRLAGVAALGVGQAWTDVLGQRTHGTAYLNTTGKPIMVAIQTGTGGVLQVSADGSAWVSIGNLGGGDIEGMTAVVPPNHHYRVYGAATLTNWAELR